MTSTGWVRGLGRGRTRHLLDARRPRRLGRRLRPQSSCDLATQLRKPAAHGCVAIERDVATRCLRDRVLARNVPLEDMEVCAPYSRDLVLDQVSGVLLARQQRVLPMRERADDA